MQHPKFRDLATDLVAYHPPKDRETAEVLGMIRASFTLLIDRVATAVPEGPDATIAARKIHEACQACIFAVVHDPPRTVPTEGTVTT